MSKLPEVLFLSASPALQVFNRPLLNHLVKQRAIAQWEYTQTPDEPCSLDIALELLHTYLQTQQQPMHLVGHGISGLLGLLYTQRYPEQVKSLSLLSVGVYPAVDWQAHYYTQRQQLPCSRRRLLTQMVQTLFGRSSRAITQAVLQILEQDLDNSLSPHSLLKILSLAPIQVSRPLLVCGGVDDVVIDPLQLSNWEVYCKESISRLWVCPGGRYFFHYFYPQETATEICQFWQAIEQSHLSQVTAAVTADPVERSVICAEHSSLVAE